MRAAVFALGLALVPGCSSSGGSGEPADAGPASGGCAMGFHPVGTMSLCEPLVFEGDCPAGSMPKIGFDTCQPVGWHDCPKGFVDDPSGWGCADVIPAAACTGATRDAVGSATCVPLGDCAAAFPPSNATLFVSPTGPVDATHFQRIGDALIAASAGAVIAVDTGNYTESVALNRAVTVIGRCAANVHILGTSSPALSVAAAGVEVHGVTASGPGEGVSVKAGGDLTLVDSLLDGNFDVGLDIETVGAAHLLRSVIRNTQAKADVSGFGAEVIFGATLDLVDSAIVKSVGGAILEGEDGTKITITNSVVRDTDPDLDAAFGYGINARNNAAMDIKGSVFVANSTGAVRISKGATATVSETVLRGTRQDGAGGDAFGFIVVDGAKLTATKIASVGNEGGGIVTLTAGVATLTDSVLRAELGTKGTNPAGDLGNGGYVFSAGRLEITGSALVDNRRSGIDVFDPGTTLTLTGSIITGTTSSLVDKMGMGLEIAMKGSATIKDSAITHNLHTGIYLWEGGTVDVSTTVIRNTQPQVFQGLLGHGLLAQDSPRVVIASSEFAHNAGIGLAFSNSSATISGTAIVGNAIGIHAQDGSTLMDVDRASGDPADLNILVGKDTIFTDNGAKTGSGLIPLPMPIPPSRP